MHEAYRTSTIRTRLTCECHDKEARCPHDDDIRGPGGQDGARGRRAARPSGRPRRDRRRRVGPGRARRFRTDRRDPARRHIARRGRGPGRHRPPAAGRQGLRRDPVRDERQARPGAVRRRGRDAHRRGLRHPRPSALQPGGPRVRQLRRPRLPGGPRRSAGQPGHRGRVRGGLGRPRPVAPRLVRRTEARRNGSGRRRAHAGLVAPVLPPANRSGRCGGGHRRDRRTPAPRTPARGPERRRRGHPARLRAGAGPGRRRGPGRVGAGPDPDRHAQRALLPHRYGAPDAERRHERLDAAHPRAGRSRDHA